LHRLAAYPVAIPICPQGRMTRGPSAHAPSKWATPSDRQTADPQPTRRRGHSPEKSPCFSYIDNIPRCCALSVALTQYPEDNSIRDL